MGCWFLPVFAMKKLVAFSLFGVLAMGQNLVQAQCSCANGTTVVSSASPSVGTLTVTAGQSYCIRVTGNTDFTLSGTINQNGAGQVCFVQDTTTSSAVATVPTTLFKANWVSSDALEVNNSAQLALASGSHTWQLMDFNNYMTLDIGSSTLLITGNSRPNTSFYNQGGATVLGSSGMLTLHKLNDSFNDGAINIPSGTFQTANEISFTTSGSIDVSVLDIGVGGTASVTEFLNTGAVTVDYFTKYESQVKNGGTITASEEIAFKATGVVYTASYALFETKDLDLSGGGANSVIDAPAGTCTVFWVHEHANIPNDYKASGNNVWIIDDTPLQGDKFISKDGPLFVQSGGYGRSSDLMFDDHFTNFGLSAPVSASNGGGNYSLNYAPDQMSGYGWGTFEYAQANASVGVYASPTDTSRGGSISDCIKQQWAVLPVRYKSFGIDNEEGGKVTLVWQTIAERNSALFEIERSTDGKHFEKIGELSGAGNSQELLSYSFVDEMAPKGTKYYRLNQIDHDGKSHKSAVKSITPAPKVSLSVLPDPADEHRKVLVVDNVKGEVNYSLYTPAGVKVNAGSHKGNDSKRQELPLTLPEGAYGIYILHLTHEGGVISQQIFVGGN